MRVLWVLYGERGVPSEEEAVGGSGNELGELCCGAPASVSGARWEVLGWPRGWSNARKTTQFLRLDGLELIGDSDLECTGSIMTYLEWPGENEPRPIT